MSDLIDRADAIKHFNDWALQESPSGFGYDAWVQEYSAVDMQRVIYQTIREAIKAIEKMPTAQERKTGEWKVLHIVDYAQRPTGRKIGECPFCGFLTSEFMGRVGSCLTNFCPNCGAEMKGAEDD